MGPIVSAFRILTIVPVPGKDTPVISRAALLFPLVGLFLGGCAMGIFWTFQSLPRPDWTIAAIVGVGLTTWLTGALHLDGLGDVADAFGGGRTREGVLEILKDSRTGVFGVTAIVFALVLKIAAWRNLFERGHVGLILFTLVLSRAMQSLVLAYFRSARSQGTAAAFCGCGAAKRVAVTVMFALIVGAQALSGTVHSVLMGSLLALVLVVLFGSWSTRKIGGITGDCVGTANEITELTLLITFSLS